MADQTPQTPGGDQGLAPLPSDDELLKAFGEGSAAAKELYLKTVKEAHQLRREVGDYRVGGKKAALAILSADVQRLQQELEDTRRATGSSEVIELRRLIETSKAESERRIAELEGSWQAEKAEKERIQNERRTEKFQADLRRLVGELNVVDTEIAVPYLEKHTRLSRDGVLELRTIGEDSKERWIMATKDAVEKARVLRPALLKSSGVPGAGSPRAVAGVTDDATGVMAKSLQSQDEYEKNKEAVNRTYTALQGRG